MAIECTKDGVKFSCQGDIGSGSVTLRQHTDVEKEGNNVEIDLSEPVSLTFSLKYLSNFTAATALSTQVKLCLSNEVPLLVEYSLSNNSYLRFYLAPKVNFPSQPFTLLHADRPADRRRGVDDGDCWLSQSLRIINAMISARCRNTTRVHGLGCRSSRAAGARHVIGAKMVDCFLFSLFDQRVWVDSDSVQFQAWPSIAGYIAPHVIARVSCRFRKADEIPHH